MAVLTNLGIEFSVGDALNSRRQIFATSTAWIFYQTTSPTGWTKSATHDNKALRVVSGSGGVFAGTNTFTSTMTSFNIGGPLTSTDSTGGHALSTSQIAFHSHSGGNQIGLAANPASYNPDGDFTGWTGGDVSRNPGWTRTFPGSGGVNPDDTGGTAHSHPVSASGTLTNQPLSISVSYIDIIICNFDG